MDKCEQISAGDDILIGFPKWRNDVKVPARIDKIVDHKISIVIDKKYISFFEDAEKNEDVRIFHGKQAENSVFRGTLSAIDLGDKTLLVTVSNEPQRMLKRSFFRIADTFPISYKRITEDTAKRLKTTLSQCPSSKRALDKKNTDMWKRISRLTASIAERDILRDMLIYMDHINRKVDAILEGGFVGDEVLEAVDVTISGSGSMFKTKEELSSGELLHIVLHLPTDPVLQIETVAQVMSSEKDVISSSSKDNFSTAVQFVHINETDRDQIVKYAFSKQREFLRSRKIIRE